MSPSDEKGPSEVDVRGGEAAIVALLSAVQSEGRSLRTNSVMSAHMGKVYFPNDPITGL